MRSSLVVVGFACVAACLAFWIEALRPDIYARFSLDPVFSRLAFASIALLAGAFLAAALVAEARLRSLAPSRLNLPQAETESAAASRNALWKSRVAALVARARRLAKPIDPVRSLAGGLQAAIMLVAAGAAIMMLLRQWPMAEELPPARSVFFTRGIVALIAAFPLLLAERAYAGFADSRLGEAPALQLLLRLALLVFAAEGISSLLEGYGFEVARYAEPLLRALILVVAGELGLRALAVFFQPAPEPDTAKAAVSSAVAGLLRPGAIRRISFRRTLEAEFGVDLSRSWALQYLRGALVPVLLLLLVFAWGLTGVAILGPDERGIYERLGRPVAVLKPGLHIGLPAPLGIVRRVDFGEVHRLSLGPVDMQAILGGPGAASVEAAAPQSADRLWDDSHPTERSYLVASDGGGRSAFQIIDVDVALIWRVALSDEAALASAYRVTEPQTLLRAFAGRLLARYFSTRTLLGALGEKREGLADELRQRLQAALDDAGAGIELVGLVVEAIHPPAKAADSYHEVQAARIRSETVVSEARRGAVGVAGEAARSAIASLAGADASASERVRLAQSDALRFETDERAYQAAKPSYLFERYLSTVRRALADAPITLLDHRIAGSGGETIIDMRSLRAMIPAPPDEDMGEKEQGK